MGGRERVMAREGGAEKSLRRERERSDGTEGVIPVPQAFVLRGRVSCVCEQAAS